MLDIVKIANRVIEYAFYLLFFLAPLTLTPFNHELFEFNKMLLVYFLAIIIVGAWLMKMIAAKKIIFRRTFFDIPLVLFLASQLISTLFSIDRHTSFWGYYSRSHGGLASTIAYLVLYWAFVSNIQMYPNKNNPNKSESAKSRFSDKIFGLFSIQKNSNNSSQFITNCLYALLASGFLVSGYGILEHFGIDAEFWMQDVKNRVFSTLGQPNWLAAWLAAIIPLTWGLALKPKTKKKKTNSNLLSAISYLLSTVFFLCLLYTKSRSGLLGFSAAFLVFWSISFWLHRYQLKKIARPFLIFTSSFLIFSFLVGTPWTPSAKEYLSPSSSSTKNSPSEYLGGQAPPLLISESSDIRRVVWQGAVEIFKHHPLFGTGVETFAYSYYWYRPRVHNDLSEWDFLYNKAHNEYLNFAATTGVLGLGAYLLMIGVFLRWCIRMYSNKNNPNKSESAISKLFGLIIRTIPIRKNSDGRKSEPPPAKAGDFSLFSKRNPAPNAQSASWRTFIPQLKLGAFWCRGKTNQPTTLHLALLSGYVSILVTNFFGFSVVPVALLFFLYPALAYSLVTEKPKNQKTKKQFVKANFDLRTTRSSLDTWQWLAIGGTFLITNYCLLITLKLWYADFLFAQGEKLNQAGQYQAALQPLQKAIKIRPKEPFYHNELSLAASKLAIKTHEQEDAPPTDQWVRLAIDESEKTILAGPYHLNFWKNRTRVFYELAEIDESYYQKALASLLQATSLAPTDAKVSYNLALLYAQIGQDQTAVQTLEETIKLKPNYTDARYALALFYEKEEKTKEAKLQLEYILQKINPQHQSAKEKLESF